jgi:hypothetical protein
VLSSLCQQCGLCCDGALFTFLPLSAGEGERMRALGARTEQGRDGRLALLLPCAALRGTCCGAYEQRPERCREYVCELGKAVVRKERSPEAALAVVAEAKLRLWALEQRLGPKAPGDERSVLQRAHQTEAGEPDDLKAVRAMTRDVEAFVQQYFVGPY